MQFFFLIACGVAQALIQEIRRSYLLGKISVSLATYVLIVLIFSFNVLERFWVFPKLYNFEYNRHVKIIHMLCVYFNRPTVVMGIKNKLKNNHQGMHISTCR